MAQLLDRNRLYALIGALEDDLRDLIRTHLLDDANETEVLGPAYENAVERLGGDQDALLAGADILDYLDLGDEIAILQRYRQALPAGVQDALTAGARRLDDLIGIRNRVMHRRPLLPDDYDNVARWLDDLAAGGFAGDTLNTTLKLLRENPSWSPAASYPDVATTGVVNNLPLPDFDETGLIGRRRQVERVKRLLAQRRFPVLTITGPGGVGKTALALQVLHEMAEDPESPYEMIAWVSLKTERLTAGGIQTLREAVRSLDQAVPQLAAPLDDSFAGGIAELSQALESINAILAIDNLETVSAEEVLSLVDELPSTITCLFTSRVGLGQVERREELSSLEPPYAADLFRRACRARQLDHLAGLPDQRVREVLGILGTSPLAIKWFVLAVEAGQAPETILRQQTDLIRFCVQNVYQSLPERAKDAAVVLAHVNRPLTIQEMKLYFPGIPPDELRRAMQELLRRSVCTISILEDTITESFLATDALAEYLRIIGGASERLIERVHQTEEEYRREEERLRLEQARTPLRVNVVSGADEHRASALRLRDALHFSAKGDTTAALNVVDEIEQLEPEYWELFRVRAFILSQSGRIEEATSAYEQSLALAPDEESKARVRFFYAGHLVRRVRNPEQAVFQAKKAHEVLRRHESALELGKALTYVRDFPTAIALLEFACETPDVRGQLIAGTQLVSSLRRRAEVESDELRSPSKALDTLNEALARGQQMLSSGIRDRRLEEALYQCMSDALKMASRLPASTARDEGLREALSVLRSLPPAGASRSLRYLAGHAARLLASGDMPPDLAATLGQLSDLDVEHGENLSPRAEGTPIGGTLVGTVKAWKPERSYGFIEALDGSGDYFFHASDLERSSDCIFVEHGFGVQFVAAVTRDKPRATMVRLREAPDANLLTQRALSVRRIGEGFLLARDNRSGVTVFVGRHAFVDRGQWEEVREGTALVADVEMVERGYAAVSGSTIVAVLPL
jgi:cold shock CspA family protein/tetratricopeptide (TPR) repeat protein